MKSLFSGRYKRLLSTYRCSMKSLIRLKWKTANCPSKLLTKNETALLDRLIGSQNKSVATTVTQLHLPEKTLYADWIKWECGVLCLIENKKDRRLSLQLFCLIRQKLIWEQKLNEHRFVYQASTSFFHTLNATNGTQVGLNFADENEATTFLRTIRAYSFKKKAIALKAGSLSRDISRPTHFRLISHIGWDSQKGFTLDSVDKQLMNTFLAGLSLSSSNENKSDVGERCQLERRSQKRKTTKLDISWPIVNSEKTVIFKKCQDKIR